MAAKAKGKPPGPPVVVIDSSLRRINPEATAAYSAATQPTQAAIDAQKQRAEAWAMSQVYAPAARYYGHAARHEWEQSKGSNGTWYGTLLDRMWTDDFSKVPVIGPGAAATAAGMTALYDWFEPKRNQVMSYGLSWLPQLPGQESDLPTLSWERAGQLSPGRVLAAMNVERGSFQQYVYEVGKQGIPGVSREAMNALIEGAPLFVPNGWTLEDLEDERWLFGDTQFTGDTEPTVDERDKQDVSIQQPIAQMMSGGVDAAVSWFIDPLVIVGKVVKVARYGTKFMGMDVVGLTHRSTASARALEQIAEETRDFLRYKETEGAEGAIRGVAHDARNIAIRTGDELKDERWAQGPYKDNILAIADLIDDEREAAIFLAAGSGIPEFIDMLFKEAPAIADAFAAARRTDPYEFAALNTPIGGVKPILLDDLLEEGLDGEGLLRDLVRRDKALQMATGLLTEKFQPIRQQYGRYGSDASKEWLRAWRAGKQHRDEVSRLGKRVPGATTEGPMTRREAGAFNFPAGEFDESRALTEAEVISRSRAAEATGPAAWSGAPAQSYDSLRLSREAEDIERNFPNMNGYRDGGKGGVGESRSVVGLVPTSLLASAPGNATIAGRLGKFDRTKITDPIMVLFDPRNGRFYVGEGNHRVQAALEAGEQALPVRVVRARIDDADVQFKANEGITVGTMSVPASPWKGGMGEDYWPSDIHPSYIFGPASRSVPFAAGVPVYHGSAGIDSLRPSFMGFSTTVSPDAARGFAGGDGKVYNVVWKGKEPPRIVDGRTLASAAVLRAASRIADGLTGQASRILREVLRPGQAPSVDTIVRRARLAIEREGLSPEDAEKVMGRLVNALRKEGIDGLSGGWKEPGTTINWLNTRKLKIVENPTAGTKVKTAREIVDDEIVPAIAAVNPRRLPGGMEGPAIHETVFKLSRGFRKVAVWEWVEGQRGSGWLTVRGMDDGYASDEWRASLTDSRALRKNMPFVKELIKKWSLGSSETGNLRRVAEIEEAAVKEMARYYGLDEQATKTALALLKSLDRKRMDLIEKSRGKKSVFGIDPDDGKIITSGPLMRSQLETKVPIIDFKKLDTVIQAFADPKMKPILKELEDAWVAQLAVDPKAYSKMTTRLSQRSLWALEGINSMWKAAVLLRLGYTQRNVFEGWLRTWAVLGMVPALAPKNIALGTGRVFKNTHSRFMRSRIDRGKLVLSNIIEGQRGLVDEVAKELADKERMIRLYERPRTNPGKKPEQPLSYEERHVLGMADAPRRELIRVYRAQAAQLRRQHDTLKALLDDSMAQYERLAARRAKYDKKFIGWDEAFSNADGMGEIRRANASAQLTVKNFFESRASRAVDESMMDDVKWAAITPDQETYFDSLSEAAVQFRMDPMGQRALGMNGSDGSVEAMMDWYRTAEGRKWAKDMNLLDEEEVLTRVTLLRGIVNDYFPTPEAMRAAGRPGTPPIGSDFRALLGGLGDLKPIHGREVKEFTESRDFYHTTINFLFKWLGSMPDSALVRQPFYNEVWKRATADAYAVARSQGLDLYDDAVVRRIQNTAHDVALKETTDTLFTIVRYSNPANMLRFLSPFFAAWENSFRTWGRIIVKDPSVAARAQILWEMPNKMGLVYDDNGNRVENPGFDFITGSRDQWVVLPKPVGDLFTTLSGGVLPSKFPKGSFNVVTPGETPFLPGFGPVLTYPSSLVLSQMPDVQKNLKDILGESIYSQAVPFGNASGDWWDTVAPTAARRAFIRWQGMNNNDYLAIVDAITVDAIIDARINGTDMPTAEWIKEQADRFTTFHALAALTLPVTYTKMSKYQPIIDYWRRLNEDNPTMTFRDKVTKFVDKYGDAYIPITEASNTGDIKGLDPSLEMYEVMTSNEQLIETMTVRGGEGAASIIAATVPDGEFDPGVYSFWLNNKQPGKQQPYKMRMTPDGLTQQTEASEMWREYQKKKQQRDNALDMLGTKSWDSKKAEEAGITQLWRDFVSSMSEKYGETWRIYGPDGYSSRLSKTLGHIEIALQDEQFMGSELGQSPVWDSIRTYMRRRDIAVQAIADGADREKVRELWAAWTSQFKYSSVKFLDFYEIFLENDDLTQAVN